jgi:predicted phosphodiesterase
MKLAILSDVHANLEALQATLRAISVQAVDRIVCLGDIVGYNASPAECIELMRKRGPLCVVGNHDRAVTGQITTEGFSHTAARAVAWTRQRLGADALAYLTSLPLELTIGHHLVAVHGALHPERGCDIVRLDDDENRRLTFDALIAHPSGARVCAFGHTHHIGIFEFRGGVMRKWIGDEIELRDDAYYLVNPGTVGQPRTVDRRATYLVFDTGRQALTVHRVEYDSSLARAKSRRAGLLPPFSFLPEPVRNPLKRAVRAAGLYEIAKRMAG